MSSYQNDSSPRSQATKRRRTNDGGYVAQPSGRQQQLTAAPVINPAYAALFDVVLNASDLADVSLYAAATYEPFSADTTAHKRKRDDDDDGDDGHNNNKSNGYVAPAVLYPYQPFPWPPFDFPTGEFQMQAVFVAGGDPDGEIGELLYDEAAMIAPGLSGPDSSSDGEDDDEEDYDDDDDAVERYQAREDARAEALERVRQMTAGLFDAQLGLVRVARSNSASTDDDEDDGGDAWLFDLLMEARGGSHWSWKDDDDADIGN